LPRGASNTTVAQPDRPRIPNRRISLLNIGVNCKWEPSVRKTEVA
jgi:hypothetical protein